MRRSGVLAGMVIAFMALSAAGSRGSAGAQQPPNIRTVIETYKRALMKLDGPAVAALFDDNIVLDNFGDTAKGKAEAIALLRDATAAQLDAEPKPIDRASPLNISTLDLDSPTGAIACSDICR